jgi:hypothetical protein
MKQCREKGIRLIQIWEHQWNNERLQPILKSIILNACSKTQNRVYARECNIRKVSKEEYNLFCKKEHIQGTRSAKDLVIYGLYYNNELKQISSFGRPIRNGKKSKIEYEWEWVRGCIASNNQVIGGTSKLLKAFIKEYNPQTILCYADANLFDGAGYEKAGFDFIGYTKFDKFYLKREKKVDLFNNYIRVNRQASKYKEYMDNVKNGKMFLCYGAGSLKYIYKTLDAHNKGK